jgi:hypothetical protein
MDTLELSGGYKSRFAQKPFALGPLASQEMTFAGFEMLGPAGLRDPHPLLDALTCL